MDILFQVTHCIEFALLINLAHTGQRHGAHLWLCHHFPCIHFLCIYWMLGFLVLFLFTPDSIMRLSLPMRLTTPIMFFLSVGSCSLCSLVKIDLLYTEMSSFIHGVAYVWTSFFSRWIIFHACTYSILIACTSIDEPPDLKLLSGWKNAIVNTSRHACLWVPASNSFAHILRS